MQLTKLIIGIPHRMMHPLALQSRKEDSFAWTAHSVLSCTRRKDMSSKLFLPSRRKFLASAFAASAAGLLSGKLLAAIPRRAACLSPLAHKD